MSSILIASSKKDMHYQLLSEYLVEKGHKVVFTESSFKAITDYISNNHTDYTILPENTEDFILRITSFLRIKIPRNQCILILPEKQANIQNLLILHVSAYLYESFRLSEINDCIISLSKGHKYICNELSNNLNKLSGKKTGDLVTLHLSKQEHNILSLLASGKMSKQIASELCISLNTLHNHKTKIKKKLKLNSNSDLLLFSIEKIGNSSI